MPSWLSRLAERIAVLRVLPQRDLSLFASSMGAALIAPLLMRIALPDLDNALNRWFAWARCARAGTADHVSATVLSALRVGRPLIRRGCLTRGLALYCGLRSAGIDAELVFGMGRADTADGYDGHCWVTVDGAPYLEPRDPRDAYVAMYTLGKSTLARRAERATSAEA